MSSGNNIVSNVRKMKSRVIIEIETSGIRKLAKEEPDANGDQVVDEVATQEFERKIHRLIASSIQDFIDDADRLDEDVIESLTTEGYDMDTLMSDPTYGNLQELGKIDVTVKQEPIGQSETAGLLEYCERQSKYCKETANNTSARWKVSPKEYWLTQANIYDRIAERFQTKQNKESRL